MEQGQPPVTFPSGSGPLSATQQEALDDYAERLSRWRSDKAIIRQAIASTIPDSLFLEVRKKEMAFEMWKAEGEKVLDGDCGHAA